MNTDTNPEDLNNGTGAHDGEDDLFSYDPTGPIDAGTTAELPIAHELEDALAPEDDGDVSDDTQNPKRPNNSLKRKLVAGGVTLAIVAALGIGLSLNHEAVNIPDNAPVASLVNGKKDTKTYTAAVTLEADGWNDGDGEFSYEVVDVDGKAAAKGDIVPGKEASVDLPKGRLRPERHLHPDRQGRKDHLAGARRSRFRRRGQGGLGQGEPRQGRYDR